MKYRFFLSLMVLFLISSCNKYSEGPAFSLLTRNARISNDWTLQSYTKDGTALFDVNAEEQNLSIEKDGTYSRTTISTTLGQLQSLTSHGTWSFENSQANVNFMESGDLLGVTYEIILLKNKTLKIRQTDFNNAVYDWTFIAD
ncbi:MAG: hypothetical protein QNL43_01180 [Crocinitomicaceae bacterium]|jgi:hypothetical protein|tara:strand:- start:684 stop:1112 length:429 start_codon:yes stop_codon:yes gene_type:complete